MAGQSDTTSLIPFEAGDVLPVNEEAVKDWWSDTLEMLLGWATDPATYMQLALVVGAIALAYGAGHVLRRVFPMLCEKQHDAVEEQSWHWFLQRSGRLFSPIILLLVLSALQTLAEDWWDTSQVIGAASRVAIVWLLWVVLKAFVTNTLVRIAAVWILVPAAILQLLGYFEPTAEYLDGMGFTLGKVEITAFSALKGLLFASVLIWVGQVLSRGGEQYIRAHDSLNVSTKELLIKLFEIALYIVLFVLMLDVIGIDLTALTVFGGALGVGLGFGLQKIASNFISGIILLMERAVTIGNLVELDNGTFGHLRKLGARASIVETYDGKEVMVPNEDFITSRVTNWTFSNSQGRVDIMIGVDYSSDIHKVPELMVEAARSYEGCLKEPAPACYLQEFNDSSVDFLLMFWIDDVSNGRYKPKSEVMFAIWDAFAEHDIAIPFPQQDLHVRSGLEALQNDSGHKGNQNDDTVVTPQRTE